MTGIYELLNLFRKSQTIDYRRVIDTHPNARGVPIPHSGFSSYSELKDAEDICPTGALKLIHKFEMQIDYGACLQCGLCVSKSKGMLRNSHLVHVYALDRDSLRVRFRKGHPEFKPDTTTDFVKQFRNVSRRSGLQFREVDAGSNGASDLEINASFNSFFDAESCQIRLVASPKHADAIVYTGPVSESMERPLQIAWDCVPSPKVLIACGTEAISGGLFAKGKLPKDADLYIAGDPPLPEVIVSAFLYLLGRREYSFAESLSREYLK